MVKRIAIDLDGTLAATHEVAFDLMCGSGHDYSYDDIKSWQWGLDRFGTARFLSAIWHAWTIRPGAIEPTQDNLSYEVRRLFNNHHVDIVTANPNHLGIKEGKRWWLEQMDIPYLDLVFVPYRQSKGQFFEYDVFIDDKPLLPSRVGNGKEVYLKRYPYTENAEGDYTLFDDFEEIEL